MKDTWGSQRNIGQSMDLSLIYSDKSGDKVTMLKLEDKSENENALKSA